MTQLDQFIPREHTSGDSYKPSEHIGSLLIVKVTEHKHITSTVHKPEGGPAVIADICDLTGGGQVYRDVLLMNGAIVDELRPWINKSVVIKFAYAKSKAGMDYITVAAADPYEMQQAQQRVAMGDPFAVQLGTVQQPAAPPAQDPWGSAPAAQLQAVQQPLQQPWQPQQSSQSVSSQPSGAQPPF